MTQKDIKSTIHQALTQADPGAVSGLAQKRFPDVYRSYRPGDSPAILINALVEYAEQNNRLQELANYLGQSDFSSSIPSFTPPTPQPQPERIDLTLLIVATALSLLIVVVVALVLRFIIGVEQNVTSFILMFIFVGTFVLVLSGRATVKEWISVVNQFLKR